MAEKQSKKKILSLYYSVAKRIITQLKVCKHQKSPISRALFAKWSEQ